MKYAAVVGMGNHAQQYLGRVYPIFKDHQGYDAFVDSEHDQQGVYDPLPSDPIMSGEFYDYVVLEIDNTGKLRHGVGL